MGIEEELKEMLEQAGAKITEQWRIDEHGGMMADFPLPENHWIYTNPDHPDFEAPPMPLRLSKDHPLRVKMTPLIVAAAKYALRASTMNGKDQDFDPDAVIQNLIVGLFGYHTKDGLTEDDWANPKQYRKEKPA